MFHRRSSLGCRWLHCSSPLNIGSLLWFVPRERDFLFVSVSEFCSAHFDWYKPDITTQEIPILHNGISRGIIFLEMQKGKS